MIRNSETENLGFVQVETFSGAYFFKRTIPPAYGYSIEAFRGKYYLGSISVEGGSGASIVQNQIKALKLQNNDTLIWISLIPRQLNMVVQLTTKESNSPVCQLTIELKVDPGRTRDFAALFNQCTGPNNDPVGMAKAPIAHALQKYVRLRSYDELDDDEMHYRVLNSLLGDNKKYGLVVDSISYLDVLPDEHMTQQTRDRKDQERASRNNDFRRSEDARENQYQRQEQDLDDQRRRRKELHDALGLTTQQGLVNILQRDLNTGKSFYDIQQQNPDMINMDTLFGLPSTGQPANQIGWQERREINAGSSTPTSLPVGKQPLDNLPEEEDIPGLLRHKFVVFSLREPGITVLRVQLSDVQRQKAAMQTQAAMLVCQVNATDTEFAVGDLIVSMEGIAVTDISILTTILKEKHPAILSAQLLRGESIVEASLPSMP